MLADALKGGSFDAVTVVHSETSTGALNPIAELARVAHDAGDVALLVDSVTGMAGAPVESDAWELDFVLTGSQKAFALPPGLAFAVARDTVLERAASEARSRHLLRLHRVRQVRSERTRRRTRRRCRCSTRSPQQLGDIRRGDDRGALGASRGDGAAHLGVGG